MALGQGMITPLRTLCPQAVGANKRELNAVYIQRAAFTVLVTSIPSVALQLNASNILVWMGQSEIAEAAQTVSLCLFPSSFFIVGFFILQRVMMVLFCACCA